MPNAIPDVPPKDVRGNDVSAVFWLGLALMVLVALMVATYFMLTPRGGPPNLLLFIVFWLRELLIVVPLVVGGMVVGLMWLWRRLRPLFTRGHDLP